MIFTFVSAGKHEECLCIELLFQPLPLLIFEQNISLGMREIFVFEYTQYIRRTDGSWSSRIVRMYPLDMTTCAEGWVELQQHVVQCYQELNPSTSNNSVYICTYLSPIVPPPQKIVLELFQYLNATRWFYAGLVASSPICVRCVHIFSSLQKILFFASILCVFSL